jgi:hypothetical protein
MFNTVAAESALATIDRLYKYFVPAVVRGEDYTPEQWSQWYERSERHGTEEFRKRLDYKQAVTPVLARHWPEFRATSAYQDLMPPNDSRRSEVGNTAIAMLLGERYADLDQRPDSDANRARALVRALLDHMKQKALGGEFAPDTSVTPERMQEWRTPQFSGKSVGKAPQALLDAANADYRLTSKGQASLQRLMDYNLLRAFQTDPEHRPDNIKGGPMGTGMGAIQNSIGLLGALLTSNPKETARMAASQLKNTLFGGPSDALDNTMMWDRWGRDWSKQNPEFWNSRFLGSAVPQGSALTLDGLDRKSNSGDTMTGQATRYMTNWWTMPGVSPEQRQTLVDWMGQNDRFTPIRPKSQPTTYQSDRMLTNEIASLEGEGQRAVSTYWPKAMKDINRELLLDSLPQGFQLPTHFPSAAVNDALMAVPNIAGDPQNLVQTLLTLGTGVVSSGGKALLRQVGSRALDNIYELPSEALTNTAISKANDPQSLDEYLTKADPAVPLRLPDNPKQIPDPTGEGYETEYLPALNAYHQKQQNVLNEAAKRLNNRRSPAAKPFQTPIR